MKPKGKSVLIVVQIGDCKLCKLGTVPNLYYFINLHFNGIIYLNHTVVEGIYMPRIRRVKGEFSTYHIVQRGNEKKNIFKNDRDKLKFLETLSKNKLKYGFLIYAYCLMDNHVHLLISDNGNDISKVMKSINVSYVAYFNHTYERCGHLFQDRFRSEIVKDDRYLLEVSRYIHNNPVKARLVIKPDEFRWSSYNVYIQKVNDDFNLLDTSLILSFFSSSTMKSVTEYKRFVDQNKGFDANILDMPEVDLNSGKEEARSRLTQFLANENLTLEELFKMRSQRNEMIRVFRQMYSLNLKELGDLFGGMSESQISRIIVEQKSRNTKMQV